MTKRESISRRKTVLNTQTKDESIVFSQQTSASYKQKLEDITHFCVEWMVIFRSIHTLIDNSEKGEKTFMYLAIVDGGMCVYTSGWILFVTLGAGEKLNFFL